MSQSKQPSPARPSKKPEDPFGPSDRSATASERPAGDPHAGTDAEGTGARPAAEPPYDGPAPDAPDIQPDRDVDEDRAGLAHTPPDPVRNGGRPARPSGGGRK